MYLNTKHRRYIPASISLSLVATYRIHVQNVNTYNLFRPFSPSLWRKNICTWIFNTENIFGPLTLSLLVTYKIHEKTLILSIHLVQFFSRFDVKIYVYKHLTQKIFSGLALSLSCYNVKIHVPNRNLENIVGLFSISLWHKCICN